MSTFLRKVSWSPFPEQKRAACSSPSSRFRYVIPSRMGVHAVPLAVLPRAARMTAGAAAARAIVQEGEAAVPFALILDALVARGGHLLRHVDARVLSLVVLGVRGGDGIHARVERAPKMVVTQQCLDLLATAHASHRLE